MDVANAFVPQTGADHIAKFITDRGQKRVYYYPGGTIAALLEGFHKQNMPLICARHEQGAGYAALAEAKLSNQAQAVMVSSGPGVTNIVTVVADAYYDSVPMIFLTGQVGVKDMRKSKKHRQAGFQEVDTANMLNPIAKQVLVVKQPDDVLAMLSLAYQIAESGRKGPVIVDLPMSTQLAEVKKPKALPTLPQPAKPRRLDQGIQDFVNAYLEFLTQSKRPILLIGNGVRNADAMDVVRKLARLSNIPYTQSLPALGILPSKISLTGQSLGYHGHTGNQAAGLALHEADLGLVLGSRLDVRQTGTLTKKFMPKAKLFQVELDPAEAQYRRVRKSVLINADLKAIVEAINERLQDINLPDWQAWNHELMRFKRNHPLPMGKEGVVTAQRIIHAVDQASSGKKTIVATGVGSHQQWTARHFNFDAPLRQWLTSAGLGAMGYDLPSAVGAAFAHKDSMIFCFVGDGSLQMNIQELATIKEHNLPIKIFCLDNQRLAIVSQFQKTKWPRDIGCGAKSNPDFAAIAAAYGMRTLTINNLDGMQRQIQQAIELPGPIFVHCHIDPDTDISPMLLAGDTLDAMST